MFINAFALMATLAFAPVQDAPAQDASPVAESAPPVEAFPAEAVVPSPIPEISEDELVLGDAGAAETMVIYTALGCPDCARWHTVGLPDLISQTVATGAVRVVTRFVPIDERAAIAAAIIRCSVKENQLNVAGAFFENQLALLDGSMTEMDWHLTGVAASGRTREEIVACLAEPATFQAVSDILRTAIAAGVEGVPSFFINGAPAAGAPITDAVPDAEPPPSPES